MLENINNKQINDRIEFIAKKMDSIWKDIEPKINEFNDLKSELESLINERQGRIDNEQDTTRKNTKRDSI